MARRSGWSEEQWLEEGRNAILDLVAEREVLPWAEVEARVSVRGWKNFRNVQPLQLNGARRSLVEEGLIEVDISNTHPAVVTIRAPIAPGQKRRIERLRGEKRKSYRRFLSWAGDVALCGKHAERVVLESLKAGAGPAHLFVPPQAVGRVSEVRGVALPGTLDAIAFILDLPHGRSDVAMPIEVKNVHDWIYPWDPRLWEVLVKASAIAEEMPTMPVLVCARTAFPTGAMARDIGFLGCQMQEQIFSDSINANEFDAVVEEFALGIRRHELESHDAIVAFLTKTIRRDQYLTEGHVPWYQMQAGRFKVMAPVIRRFAGLASDVPAGSRRSMFRGFRVAAESVAEWNFSGGWG